HAAAALPKDEGTLCRGLRTSPLPGTHASVGDCWQNSRCCHLLQEEQHNFSDTLVSHPNATAQQPAHAGLTSYLDLPSVAWPVCCSAWFPGSCCATGLSKVHGDVFILTPRLDANAVTCPPVLFDRRQRVAIVDVLPAGRAIADIQLPGPLELAPGLRAEELEPTAAVLDRQRYPSLPHATSPSANAKLSSRLTREKATNSG